MSRLYRSCVIVLIALSAALATIPTPHCLAQPPKPKGTNYAFLVACGEYDINELRKLPYSIKETEEFRQVLLATGYEEKNIKFLNDSHSGANRRYLPEKKKIIAEFELMLSRVTSEDTVLVLLNGHGLHFMGDKTGYFCPVDSKLGDKGTLWAMDGPGSVFDSLKGCKAKRKLLLVNACRNDPSSDRSLAGDKIKLDDHDNDEVPEGIAALYSCKPGQKSYYYDPKDPKTKDRERSLFMHHLIESWGKGGKVTIEEVFKNVRENAASDADNLFGRAQTPVVRREYKGEGEWVIARELSSIAGLKAGEEREFEIAVGLKMVFCWIPAGETQLGSPKEEQDYFTKTYFDGKRSEWLDDEDESKRGRFKTKGFWLGKYTVTQAEWKALMGNNPSEFDGKKDNKAKELDTSRFPVEKVSWNMIAQEEGCFLEKLNLRGSVAKVFGKDGKFALPHEDQWEYACRGGKGNKRPFYWGDELNGTQANCIGYTPYGADRGPTLDRTCSVDFTNGGKYPKHPWGLCHMSGNVWQWCNNRTDPSKEHRVIRGGSWSYGGGICRSACRMAFPPNFSGNGNGFRVLLDLE
jgi:sulfatase modifying factor 1